MTLPKGTKSLKTLYPNSRHINKMHRDHLSSDTSLRKTMAVQGADLHQFLSCILQRASAATMRSLTGRVGHVPCNGGVRKNSEGLGGTGLPFLASLPLLAFPVPFPMLLSSLPLTMVRHSHFVFGTHSDSSERDTKQGKSSAHPSLPLHL